MTARSTSPRRLSAIVVADVVGYSRLLAEDEAGTLAALKERRNAIVEPLVKLHSGRIVKFLGDGVLIEFQSAVNAVAFALDTQRRMAEINEPLPQPRRILIRIGISLGEVVGEGADIFGDGVNVASRLETVAEPGGIVISAKVHDEVRGKLDIQAEDLGEIALKNIPAPVRCWQIKPSRAREAASIRRPGGSGDRITIAVLPFANLSGDASQEYLVDGLTEDLITALAKFRFFSVLSRNATFQFKGRAVDIPAVGRQLGAHYVLEGSIRKGGNRIRVTAQLIDADDGSHIWAEKFDRELVDVFAVQDEIVNAIAGQLSFNIVDAEVVTKRSVPKGNLSAYDCLLRGRSAWRRGAVFETMEMWRRAVETDPTYGPGLAALAFFYSEDAWMQVTGKPVSELVDLASEYIRRAIAADDGDAFTQHAIATALMGLGEIGRAKQHYELAITLNPHNPNTTINLGLTIFFMGCHDDGLAMIAEGFRIDPRLPPAMQAVPFYAHCLLGAADAAEADLARIQDPLAFLHLMMATCFAAANRMEEASRELEKFETKRPPWFDILGLYGIINRCLQLPEDKVRWREASRKLGLNI